MENREKTPEELFPISVMNLQEKMEFREKFKNLGETLRRVSNGGLSEWTELTNIIYFVEASTSSLPWVDRQDLIAQALLDAGWHRPNE